MAQHAGGPAVVRYVLELRARGSTMIGGITNASFGVHAQTALARPDVALLPGSAVKGVLRHISLRLAESQGQTCLGAPDCRCITCRFFGTESAPGALLVRSASANDVPRRSAHVAIDRHTRTASRASGLLWAERRTEVDFVVPAELSTDDGELIDWWRYLSAWVEATGLHVGQRKSTGAGWFSVVVREEDPADARAVSHPSGPGPWRLVFELLEPVRLSGLRQRDFYRASLDRIPLTTVRGAVGWALARRGDGDTARDLFIERPVRLTGAWLIEGDVTGPPGHWRGVARCRGAAGHLIDTAPRVIASAVAAQPASGDDQGCPHCGEPLKAAEAPSPRRLVHGHTSIDVGTGRAADGELYQQVVLAPGQTFVALIDAQPEQIAAVASLGEVLLGGSRSRGAGRAALRVEQAGRVRSVEERLAATAVELGRHGVEAGDVAVLGLLTDAAPPGRLAEALGSLGLEVITANVRGVIVGGWDEMARAPRAIRELHAAGSWVAVHAAGSHARDALVELEASGLDDPGGVDHGWWVVRDFGGHEASGAGGG